MRQQHPIALAPLVALTMVLALLAGCSGKESSSASAAGGAEAVSTVAADASGAAASMAVVKDQTHWSLPSDPYAGGQVEALYMQAYEVLRVPCMHEAGYPDVKVGWDASAPAPQTQASNGIGTVFNEDIAAKYGYHLAPDPRYLVADEIEAHGGSLWSDRPQEFWDALEKCNAAADEAIGRDSRAGLDEASVTLSSNLINLTADTKQPALAAAAAAWKQCMAPLGIADLPSEPWAPGGILQSLMQRFDISSLAAGTPSAEEIQTASFDAACRRSSGWFDALYEAEWNLHQEFVDAHRSELEAVRQSLEAKRALYQSIIAKGHA